MSAGVQGNLSGTERAGPQRLEAEIFLRHIIPLAIALSTLVIGVALGGQEPSPDTLRRDDVVINYNLFCLFSVYLLVQALEIYVPRDSSLRRFLSRFKWFCCTWMVAYLLPLAEACWDLDRELLAWSGLAITLDTLQVGLLMAAVAAYRPREGAVEHEQTDSMWLTGHRKLGRMMSRYVAGMIVSAVCGFGAFVIASLVPSWGNHSELSGAQSLPLALVFLFANIHVFLELLYLQHHTGVLRRLVVRVCLIAPPVLYGVFVVVDCAASSLGAILSAEPLSYHLALFLKPLYAVSLLVFVWDYRNRFRLIDRVFRQGIDTLDTGVALVALPIGRMALLNPVAHKCFSPEKSEPGKIHTESGYSFCDLSTVIPDEDQQASLLQQLDQRLPNQFPIELGQGPTIVSAAQLNDFEDLGVIYEQLVPPNHRDGEVRGILLLFPRHLSDDFSLESIYRYRMLRDGHYFHEIARPLGFITLALNSIVSNRAIMNKLNEPERKDLRFLTGRITTHDFPLIRYLASMRKYGYRPDALEQERENVRLDTAVRQQTDAFTKLLAKARGSKLLGALRIPDHVIDLARDQALFHVETPEQAVEVRVVPQLFDLLVSEALLNATRNLSAKYEKSSQSAAGATAPVTVQLRTTTGPDGNEYATLAVSNLFHSRKPKSAQLLQSEIGARPLGGLQSMRDLAAMMDAQFHFDVKREQERTQHRSANLHFYFFNAVVEGLGPLRSGGVTWNLLNVSSSRMTSFGHGSF